MAGEGSISERALTAANIRNLIRYNTDESKWTTTGEEVDASERIRRLQLNVFFFLSSSWLYLD